MPELTDRDRKFQLYFALLAPQYAHLTSNTTYDLLLQAFNGPLRSRLSNPLTSSDPVTVHDNASGPGTATSALLAFCQSADLPVPTVHATDYTEAMIEALQREISARGWEGPKVTARVADSQALDFGDDTFDLGIVNFSIANFDNAEMAMRELYRTLKPGVGTAIVANWETFGFATVLNAAMKKVRPSIPGPLPAAGQEFMQEDVLVKTLVSAGFEKHKILVYQTEIVVGDAERLAGMRDFMTGPYLGPVASTLSEEEKKEWPAAVAKSIEEAKAADGGVLCKAWVLAASK
ncbi:uncharacterized protein Z520_03049 [Fonsecaea multimorphosa CBS 102226]|uniref:Methyltransferase domain-containing protein n=1 Tax=Fonsecaea multimorphosa CBS 102226 TaxID=1442371 RepID=A0A0D2IWY8_9EURO|nr:uncharacterized protein Z520_03049 [Fonsecaea multimorphosa CBS 102226]KIY01497.1 hypothetical protein Z520_03049 [Fonsecaea multimorphosa CBS 102226]OAL28259.1 hypothetical protein AYO22_02965 [Fonsecaea multimorphosa]